LPRGSWLFPRPRSQVEEPWGVFANAVANLVPV
jgi:hypothetical protein